MKRKLNELMSFTIITRDGLSAEIKDFLFDIRQWDIQYFIVVFKKNKKKALLPINLFKYAQIINTQVFIDILESEIKHFERKKDMYPEQLIQEEKLIRFSRLSGKDVSLTKTMISDNDMYVNVENKKLISFEELTRYRITAQDMIIGNIDDLIVENNWQILYFIINHRYNVPASKKGLLSVYFLRNVQISPLSIEIDMEAEKIKKSVLFMNEKETALVDAGSY